VAAPPWQRTPAPSGRSTPDSATRLRCIRLRRSRAANYWLFGTLTVVVLLALLPEASLHVTVIV